MVNKKCYLIDFQLIIIVLIILKDLPRFVTFLRDEYLHAETLGQTINSKLNIQRKLVKEF